MQGREVGQTLAIRIIAEVHSNPVTANGQQIVYMVSIGANCLSLQTKLAQFLAECDTALYRAKKTGRDRLEVSWDLPANTV